ncbi:tetratricopeptide repeat protein [Nocardia suismassiliense]|uniref:tetratricopeptide repeat protein n=1 Tax=Nocardia suismassiliense TaxID=2077092 RepID=UPI001F2D5B17|nr:tetratricopeptide repeat protein [Nocardia suismassiliense]
MSRWASVLVASGTWRTDLGVVSAAFGLARQLAAVDRMGDVVHALKEVPAASRHFTTARMTAVLLLLTAAPVAVGCEVEAASCPVGCRRWWPLGRGGGGV